MQETEVRSQETKDGRAESGKSRRLEPEVRDQEPEGKD
jgi:hypothetical protein